MINQSFVRPSFGDSTKIFGEVVLLQSGGEGRFRITPELAIHNPGSTLAVVHELSFELVRLSNDVREPLIWTENVTTVFKDDDRRRDTRFESFPGILFIGGGEAAVKRVALESAHPYEPSATDYELSVRITSDGTARRQITARTKIRLDDDDVRFLKAHQLSPTNTTRRLLLLYFQRGKNTNCFLRAPGFK